MVNLYLVIHFAHLTASLLTSFGVSHLFQSTSNVALLIKYNPVNVEFVMLVCFVIPPFTHPFSTGLCTNHAIESVQSVLSTQDREVGEGDLIGVAVNDRRHAIVTGVHCLGSDVQLVVASIVDFLPLEFAIGSDKPFGRLHGFGEGDVGPVWRRG